MGQSNTVSLLGNVVMSGIQNGIVYSRQTNPDATPEESCHDASVIALQNLIGNSSLRIVKATKDLQAEMGPLPKSMGGKTLATLRREKKEAKKSGCKLIAQ